MINSCYCVTKSQTPVVSDPKRKHCPLIRPSSTSPTGQNAGTTHLEHKPSHSHGLTLLSRTAIMNIPFFPPHCCVQTLMNTLLEHQHSTNASRISLSRLVSEVSAIKASKDYTNFSSFFLLFYIRRTATFHFLSDTSRVKESGRCMFWDRWLGISRLPLWQRPMRRVSAPSISRPRPVAEAGLNHLPDRHCHLSFGHL